MAKLGSNSKKKNISSIVKLNFVVKKLQKSLQLGRKSKPYSNIEYDQEVSDSSNLPEDVKEGHFSVIAMKGDELKRFVVPLNFLTRPTFLRLRDEAAEEYGFDHEGALTIPCRPVELERLQAADEQRQEEGDSSNIACVKWDSYYRTIVQSC